MNEYIYRALFEELLVELLHHLQRLYVATFVTVSYNHFALNEKIEVHR